MWMKKIYQNIIVIVGPTASGKSDLAIALAKKYNGEIISADSRQVYKGMDIGTGKVTEKEQKNIPHWLLDRVTPKTTYNITHFIRDTKKAIADIQKRGKTPIICGGTGFWVQSFIEGNTFPSVKPNTVLRKKLEALPLETLVTLLRAQDPKRAETIDTKNKIRIIRALEICEALGSVPIIQKKSFVHNDTKRNNFLIIALCPPKEKLDHNILVRLEKRFKQGMIEEVTTLHSHHVSWKRLESFGLEYKYIALFLQKKISLETMKERLYFEIKHYAKRQFTWLKRWQKENTAIHFITDPQEAREICQKNLR